MAKEASVRISKAEIELLTEGEQLSLIERAVRRGNYSLYEMWKLMANKKYLPK